MVKTVDIYIIRQNCFKDEFPFILYHKTKIKQTRKTNCITDNIQKMAAMPFWQWINQNQKEPDLDSWSRWSVWKTTVAMLIEHRQTVIVPSKM